MNLHGIVSRAIGTVNPLISATLLRSTGYTKAADFTQVPSYADPQTVLIQIQALQYSDLAQLDGLNVQGVRRAVYLKGNWDGVIRADKKGGDILKFAEHPGAAERTWLVVLALEYWPDWTKVAVTLQTDEHA